MMCCATGGIIFTVPLALSRDSGLEMVPEEEEIGSVCSLFCYVAGVVFRNTNCHFEFCV